MPRQRKDNPAFGRRLSKAKADWNDAHYPEKISDEEIGIRVARKLKRPEPYSYQAVGAWMKGREPDSFEVVRALAEVLGCDAADLAFGPAGGSEPLPAPSKRKKA